MRRVLLLLSALGTLACAALLSLARPDTSADTRTSGLIRAKVEERNPWTSLTANQAPEQFSFAIVSDRTGGHRPAIFSRAVQQINLLQPSFVVSVGDLIEGSPKPEVNREQWAEFQGYIAKLQMPFFYTPGNHDTANRALAEVWQERYGRRYYHFVYKDCLFLILNAYDEEGSDPKADRSYRGTHFGATQRAYIEKALKENPNARWTFAFVHPPVWTGRDLTETGWLELEKLLEGRKYTVFAGHIHVYRKFLRKGMNYYQLATTGGSSSLRGLDYGEFDQIAWVTMKKDEPPIVANLMLNGVLRDDLVPFETDEKGRANERVAGQVPVTGRVTLNDKPGTGLAVTFTMIQDKSEKPDKPFVGGARVAADGTYVAYGNRGAAGLRPGRYAVTVDVAAPLVVGPETLPNPVPEKYRQRNTTPFRVEVTGTGNNEFSFDLKSDPG